MLLSEVSTSNASGGVFISSQGVSELTLLPKLIVSECEFNSQYFDNNQFGLYGVEYSSCLDNAVCKRKSEFLAGRYVANKALNYLGVRACAVGVGKDRCPVWPSGVVGSITHTSSQAVCAVATTEEYQAIGIDLENWLSYSRANSIKSGIISPKEEKFIQQLRIPVDTALTIIFSAKESLFKALYPQVGRYFGFYSVEVVSIDLSKNQLELALTEELMPNLKKGDVFHGSVITHNNSVFTIFRIASMCNS